MVQIHQELLEKRWEQAHIANLFYVLPLNVPRIKKYFNSFIVMLMQTFKPNLVQIYQELFEKSCGQACVTTKENNSKVYNRAFGRVKIKKNISYNMGCIVI